MRRNRKANAIVVTLMVTLLIVVVTFSIVGIYINKAYSVKSLNSYYDKLIEEQLDKSAKEK